MWRLTNTVVDYLISGVVFIQSALVIFQQIMIEVWMMSPDSTTIYRVLLSGILMIFAIMFSLRRAPLRFILVYGAVLMLLCAHIILFPQNIEYIKTEASRFLLPMVIPSALCLSTITNIENAEKALYVISWVTLVFVIYYIVEFFKGSFIIESYNMSFSYGCLLPMVSFYRQRKLIDYLIAILLLVIVLAIGSRGAAIVFIFYVFYDIFQSNKKWSLIFIVGILLLFLSLPTLSIYLDTIGINSRTLTLLANGDINQDSGRSVIYNYFINLLNTHPLLGLGLFGDRVYLDGYYCHNIFLEMLLNFGYLGVLFIWPVILIIIGWIYVNSNKINKNRIVCYTIVLIGPLLVSHSYLTYVEFGIYCGFLSLILKDSKKQTFGVKNQMQ